MNLYIILKILLSKFDFREKTQFQIQILKIVEIVTFNVKTSFEPKI